MKRIIILILALALSSVLLLSACAPDEPETFCGKQKLSQLSDEELTKVINEFELFDLTDDLTDTRECIKNLEQDPFCYIAYSSKNLEQDLFFEYYQVDYNDFVE